MTKSSLRIIAITILLLQISCQSQGEYRYQDETNNTDYLTVTRVVDGDTFWAANGTKKGVKVRLIGVDAPESKKTGKKEIGYYGKEAKVYLTNLLKGKRVRLVSDVDSLDRYGRTLSYVYLEDGTFVNAELMKNGFAMVMTIPPNVKYADLFVKLQRDARKRSRGLWKK